MNRSFIASALAAAFATALPATFAQQDHDRLRFAQLTDAHLFDSPYKSDRLGKFPKDSHDDNVRALRWAIARVNELNSTGRPIDFVVFTGDLGLECVRQTILRKDPKTGSSSPATVGFTHPNAAVDELGALIRESTVKTWLFVPGNNDVFSVELPTADPPSSPQAPAKMPPAIPEAKTPNPPSQDGAPPNKKPEEGECPEYIGVFHQFVAMLRQSLRPDYDIRDLGPQDASLTAPMFERNDCLFVGFDNSTFKHDWDGRRPFVPRTQMECLLRLERLVPKDHPMVYVLCHIPYADDPKKEDGKWRSSWDARPDMSKEWVAITTEWENFIKPSNIKQVFAGHFHSSDRKVYENIKSWHETPGEHHNPYPNLDKLTVCPPLALKFQAGNWPGARGFLDVRIDPKGDVHSKPEWFYGDERIPEPRAKGPCGPGPHAAPSCGPQPPPTPTDANDSSRRWAALLIWPVTSFTSVLLACLVVLRVSRRRNLLHWKIAHFTSAASSPTSTHTPPTQPTQAPAPPTTDNPPR
jgi:hypothetical protein